MPALPTPGRVYKTTEAQRASAATWKAKNREKALGYGRALTIRQRDAFIGPRRPRGRQPSQTITKGSLALLAAAERRKARETIRAAKALGLVLCRLRARLERESRRPVPKPPADRSKAARRGNANRRAKFIGPPKPEAIDLAQRRAKMNERQRIKVARFRARFVGPPKPPRTALVRPPAPRKPRPTKSSRSTPATPRPPRGTKPRQVRAVVFGPPRPTAAQLRAVIRQEVAEAKAQAAADKAAAKALTAAGRAWDTLALKALRKAARTIREQVREAAQIAARRSTPEDVARHRAAFQAAMASMSEAPRNSFVRRAQAEQDRMTGQAPAVVAETSSEAAALAAAMRSPVRRVAPSPSP